MSRLRLAQKLGKHLHELMGWDGPMTHRQLVLCESFDELEWNSPDRNDHYLMQVAREIYSLESVVVGLFGGKLPEPPQDRFKIEFTTKEAETIVAKESTFGPKRLTKETLAKAQKAITLARLNQSTPKEENPKFATPVGKPRKRRKT